MRDRKLYFTTVELLITRATCSVFKVSLGDMIVMSPSKMDTLLSAFSLVPFRCTCTRRWNSYFLHIFLREDPMAVRARASYERCEVGAKSGSNEDPISSRRINARVQDVLLDVA
jgi:hypothetical protein